jgi:NAD(P)-dependent dehydrogenase (short-subunit alcohol dehydrogenase family)
MLGSLSPVEHLDPKELQRVFALNLFANQALIAAFDPLLRRSNKAEVVAITSSVGAEPRAFWGGYGASKAALDTMLGAYADETSYAGRLRVHIVDPGATATRMRQLAFPGEEASTLKGPEVVASAIVDRLNSDAPTGGRMRVEG